MYNSFFYLSLHGFYQPFLAFFIEISAPPTAADYEKHESAEVSLIAMDMVNHFIFDHR